MDHTIDLNPIRKSNTWVFADGTILPVIAGGDGPVDFPTIPEDRSVLTSAELRTLVRELRTYARAQLAERGEDFRPNAQRASTLAAEIFSEATALDEDAALAATLSEDGDPVEPEVEPEGDDDDDGDDDASTPTEPAVAPPAELAPVSAPVGTATGATTAPASGLTPDIILARDGVAGLSAGDSFEGWDQVAHALHDRATRINPSTNEKFEVGVIEGNYPLERQLGADPIANMRLLENLGFDQEITAALCAPLTPYYGLACENTLRRPVAASLPGFQAPRGGVTTMSSPSLSDVSQAGIWTHEDDDDPEAVKPCDVIECGTPEDFLMYAVYWCLTIKNWTALTYPELVAAFLNRGLASRARLAEQQLLDAMGAGVATINAQTLGYGSTVSVTTQILNYLTLRRELERWDDEPMLGWTHRWLLNALRIDLSRRRRDGTWQIASEAEVNARFADIGINMTWTLETGSWGTPPPDLTFAGNPSAGLLGTLSPLPSETDILLAPIGKYAMIDRAALQIGVTGNNYYRDTTELKKNQFTFFVENYEGVVDTMSCRAHILHFEGLCHSGRQIADVLIDCDGEEAA